MYMPSGGVTSNGNVWIYGFNSVWQFNPRTLQWAWMHGNLSTDSIPSVAIAKGVPHPDNIPATRSENYIMGVDSRDTLWIFGGVADTDLADVWSYNTTSNVWTWQSGNLSSSIAPVYGPKDEESESYSPGSRYAYNGCMDKNDYIWIFGGKNEALSDYMGDLWRYNTKANMWAWMGGSQGIDAQPNFGTKGVASDSNTPGSRWEPAIACHPDGSIWLFGGYQEFSSAPSNVLNDIWKFNTSSLQWTWVHGPLYNASIESFVAKYRGIGEFGPEVLPVARENGYMVYRGENLLMLYGGNGFRDSSCCYSQGEVLVFNITLNQWALMANSTDLLFDTFNGTSPLNNPGPREKAFALMNNWGDYWVFNNDQEYGDLWLIDGDGCLSEFSACSPLVTCIDHLGYFECGPCPSGYSGNGRYCTDIDECKDNANDCNANADCVNTDSSFNCVCRQGFTGDGHGNNGCISTSSQPQQISHSNQVVATYLQFVLLVMIGFAFEI